MPSSEHADRWSRPHRAARSQRGSAAIPHLRRGPGGLRSRQQVPQLLIAQLAEGELAALGAKRRVAGNPLLPACAGSPSEHEPELVLRVLGVAAADGDDPLLAA